MLFKDAALYTRVEDDGSANKWYAIHVRPRCEFSIAHILHNKGYRPFVPQYENERQWSDRTVRVGLPLFPGYIFCQFDVNTRMPILTTPGVLGLVGAGKVPVPLAADEIEAVRRAVESGGAVRPHPYIATGTRVRIEQGPLAGLNGIVKENWNRSLVVSIDLIQQSILIDLDHVLPLHAQVAE